MLAINTIFVLTNKTRSSALLSDKVLNGIKLRSNYRLSHNSANFKFKKKRAMETNIKAIFRTS